MSDNRLNLLQRQASESLAGQAERAHSNLVRRLRFALPMLALVVLAVVMVWPTLEQSLNRKLIDKVVVPQDVLEQAKTENRVLHANYASVDDKGRPYTISAREAVQEKNNPDSIFLEAPQADIAVNDTENLIISSKHGLYEQAQSHLSLMDDVTMTHSDGTVLKTTLLYFKLGAQSASTHAPVIVTGPRGTLKAAGLDVQNRGDVTIFKGPATLTLQTSSSLKPGEAQP